MSYVRFNADGAVLRGRIISEYHENVKVYVEGELFERLIPRSSVIEWVKPGRSGRRARSRRRMTGGASTSGDRGNR